ncbi:MAG: hypothetical protein QXH07_02415 [Thermoplasmata archaeon]
MGKRPKRNNGEKEDLEIVDKMKDLGFTLFDVFENDGSGSYIIVFYKSDNSKNSKKTLSKSFTN